MLRGDVLRSRVLKAGMVVAGLVAAGCGGTKSITSTAGAGTSAGGSTAAVTPSRTYVGRTVCIGCHNDTGGAYMHTKHATAFAALQGIKQDKNTVCIPCHTVGYGQPTGYTDAVNTPGLQNVQCENCHGPGGAHVASPSSATITKDVDPAVCGGCHNDAQHPTFDEWKTSKHSVSLSSNKTGWLATAAASGGPNSRTRCVACHSGEGFLYQLTQPVLVATRGKTRTVVAAHKQAVPPPTLEAATHDIICWTCHDPHDATNDKQLRVPKDALCEVCHRTAGFGQSSFFDNVPIISSENFASTTAANNPNHAQGAIFEGVGALTPNGTATGAQMNGPNSAHTTAAVDGCPTCHVFKQTVTSPDEGNPNVMGHTFEPNLNACTKSGCHAKSTARQEASAGPILAGADPAILKRFNDAQTAYNALLAQVAAYQDKTKSNYIDIAWYTNAKNPNMKDTDYNDYYVALYDYKFVNANDNSHGIHNTQYSTAVLNAALATFKKLKTAYPLINGK